MALSPKSIFSGGILTRRHLGGARGVLRSYINPSEKRVRNRMGCFRVRAGFRVPHLRPEPRTADQVQGGIAIPSTCRNKEVSLVQLPLYAGTDKERFFHNRCV